MRISREIPETASSRFKLHREAQVGTPLLLPRTATSAPAAKDITEDIAENIADVTAKPGGTTCTGTGCRMPELVVGRSLVRILENIVGFLGFFEMLLRIRIIRITVRMVFHRKLAVSLFELNVRNVSLNPEHFVIVAFCHNG